MKNTTDTIECEEFYNLMQAYRHTPITDFDMVLHRYEDVKRYISSLLEQETIDYDISKWKEIGIKRGYWDFFLEQEKSKMLEEEQRVCLGTMILCPKCMKNYCNGCFDKCPNCN